MRIEGGFVECGVAMGGTAVFLGEYARPFKKTVYALDSFTGLPAPNPVRDNPYFSEGDYAPYDQADDLLERFQKLLKGADLEGVVRPMKGWLTEMLPTIPEKRFAFVHIDVDLHDSASQALSALYPRISPGGVLAIDDFFHPAQGVRRAVEDYFRSRGETPLYHVMFPYGVVIMKDEPPPAGGKRAFDGNIYSLDYLRGDALLRSAVKDSLAAAMAHVAKRPTANARRLLDVLSQDHNSNVDIYEYWCAMQDFWVAIDVGAPNEMHKIRI